jgi:hypothetical protein
MIFKGLAPLPEHKPVVELSNGGRVFDLHNDCLITGFEYDLAAGRFAIRFASSSRISEHPRTPTYRLILWFRYVSRLLVEGDLAAGTREPVGLDFVEYSESTDKHGEMRFVLDHGTEVVVLATECELSLVE